MMFLTKTTEEQWDFVSVVIIRVQPNNPIIWQPLTITLIMLDSSDYRALLWIYIYVHFASYITCFCVCLSKRIRFVCYPVYFRNFVFGDGIRDSWSALQWVWPNLTETQILILILKWVMHHRIVMTPVVQIRVMTTTSLLPAKIVGSAINWKQGWCGIRKTRVLIVC